MSTPSFKTYPAIFKTLQTQAPNNVLKLSTKALTLYNIQFDVAYTNMNLTIYMFDKAGNPVGEPITFTTPFRIKIKLSQIAEIIFSDPNTNANIIVIYQYVEAKDSYSYEWLSEESDVEITPVTGTIIESPLDTNGYVETNDLILNSKISKLNQDSSGNVGVNIENTPSVSITGQPINVNAIKPQNNAILLNGGSITANTTWTYKPQSNKISILIHITAVSGTSPTLNLYVYAIDPAGSVLTGDTLASSQQFTTTGDQVINVDLYGVQEIQISAVVGGTSPSFTGYISVEG
jgi:hypothetical protein